MEKFPEFGSKVTVKANMKKLKKPGARTVWVRFGFDSPQSGIYIGKRVVFDGETITEVEYDDDYGSRTYTWKWFAKGKHHNFALVVLGPHTNPIYVALEDLVECFQTSS